MLAGMGCLKNTAILEINAILPFTHNRSGQQMDLSKINRKKKENSGEEKLRKVESQLQGEHAASPLY